MADHNTSEVCPMSLFIRQKTCYEKGLSVQEEDLFELMQHLNLEENNINDDHDLFLRRLVQKTIDHFEEYADQRARLASEHVSPYFSPRWCPQLESALLWLGGCRPTMFIRLVYALAGINTEVFIRELLNEGVTYVSEVVQRLSITASQLISIDALHRQVVREEDKLAGALASMQEGIADVPIAIIIRDMDPISVIESPTMPEVAREALIEQDKILLMLLQEGDKLRIETLKELMNILNPHQAVDFLISSKKLHLCVHQLGSERDHKYSSRRGE